LFYKKNKFINNRGFDNNEKDWCGIIEPTTTTTTTTTTPTETCDIIKYVTVKEKEYVTEMVYVTETEYVKAQPTN